MPDTQSTRYTIGFAAAICVVCALLVAASAVGLRERQETNQLLYRQKNVLLAAGLRQARTDDLPDRRAPRAVRPAHPRAPRRPRDRRSRRRRPDGREDLRPAQGARRPAPRRTRRRPTPRRSRGCRTTAPSTSSSMPRSRTDRAARDPGRGRRHVGHAVRLPRDRPRHDDDQRPHLLRPEGDARPGRRGGQRAVAGAVARTQGVRRELGAPDRRHQGHRRARRRRTRIASTACRARRSPATASRA